MTRRLAKIIFVAVLLAFGSAGQSARAEFLSAAFESAWGRYLLTETAEGTEILALLTREGLTLESAENHLIRSNLDERFQYIGKRFEAQTQRTLDSDTSLTIEEKVALKAIARQELQINSRWSSVDRTRTEFLSKSPEITFEARAEEFLNAKEDPARTRESRTPERGGAGRIRKFLAEAKSCVESMPPATRKTNDLLFTAYQLFADETMTVAGKFIDGKVVASGSKPVQWKDLPADLVYEAIGSVGASRLSMSKGRFMLNWVKLAGFGLAHAGGDAVVYSLVPMKEDHAESASEAVIDRLKYNVLWSTLDAPVQIGLYNLIAGMQCLGKPRALVIGIQVGAGLTSNVGYFGLRRMFMD